MASILQNDYAKGVKIQPIGDDSDVVSIRLEYNLAAALVINDVLDLGFLPAGHVPVDCMLDSDDLDTNGTPTITLSVGVLNAGKTAISTAAADGGAAWILASTVAQAGGLVRPTIAAITRCASSETPRSVGVLVAAAPATGTAVGKVGLTFSYRPSCYGG
jgi:hypothetical protein